MSTEKTTWYRPERHGKELLEELCVVGETKEFITVESTDWSGKAYTRRQAKSGAVKTKREALEAMLANVVTKTQRARDEVSVLVQKRQRIEQALAKEIQP